MSHPYPPYYFVPAHDVYHWERACPRNWYPASGWQKSGTAPLNKDRCAVCEALVEFRQRDRVNRVELTGRTLLIPQVKPA